jgi:hypothetical protein
MKTNIENKKFVTEVVSKNITFPYYGWWSHKKEDIIKMYPEYYEHDKSVLKRIVVVKIKMGWNTDTEIRKDFISVSNNVISSEIQIYLRDYADQATEAEFLEFRNKAIIDLI